MIPSLICCYYDRFLPPYVDGSLRTQRYETHCALEDHLASCDRCRESLAKLQQTDRELRRRVWNLETATILQHERSMAWLNALPLAEKVEHQLLMIEEDARRRRRMGAQFSLAFALAAVLLLVAVARPNPARNWVCAQLFGRATTVTSPVALIDQRYIAASNDSIAAQDPQVSTAGLLKAPLDGKTQPNTVHSKGTPPHTEDAGLLYPR